MEFSAMNLPLVHTDFPEEPGEAAVARALVDAGGGAWSLWFGLQRNNNEMDALVLAPGLGCFCIEVKAWGLSSIREYTDDKVTTGSGVHRHPLKQAQMAMHGLMSHLDERGISKSNKPFFYATAALPFIARSDMFHACGDEFSRHFEGMLFKEDLGDPDKLRKRLMSIGDDPPLGRSLRRHVPRQGQIDAVEQILNRRVVIAHVQQAPGVVKAFHEIHRAALDGPVEKSHPNRPQTAAERRAELLRPGASIRDGVSRVVFHGKAGTGKTTDLLKIALAHALDGQLTLVCCYTKVLASELRARMAVLPGFADAAGSLLVVDMGQLGDRAEEQVGFGGFQTICVDEAQDVAQDKFESLMALAAADAEWFLSDSPDQAIYDQRSTFVDNAVQTARRNGTWEPKRVNLRSGVAERLISDAALEISPDISRIAAWVQSHPVKTTALSDESVQGSLDIAFETEILGTIPDLVWLPSSPGWGPRVAAYEEILRSEVERAKAERRTLDLAIVSLRLDDMKDEWKKIKAALTSLGIPWLDQVDATNRRRSPQAGEVRLSTIHSIRGVDAERVLLLDLEGMEIMPEAVRPALLNIALSRARSGTRIVLRPMAAPDGSYRAFVEELIEEYVASV